MRPDREEGEIRESTDESGAVPKATQGSVRRRGAASRLGGSHAPASVTFALTHLAVVFT